MIWIRYLNRIMFFFFPNSYLYLLYLCFFFEGTPWRRPMKRMCPFWRGTMSWTTPSWQPSWQLVVSKQFLFSTPEMGGWRNGWSKLTSRFYEEILGMGWNHEPDKMCIYALGCHVTLIYIYIILYYIDMCVCMCPAFGSMWFMPK